MESKQKPYADLHTHTNASDGLKTPEELVSDASRIGLSCLAITDHDTTDGLNAGIQAGCVLGIRVIPGIEINTQWAKEEIHLLGYFIDYKLDWLQHMLIRIRDTRLCRGEGMVKKLNTLYGFDIAFEEVQQEAGSGAIARPHIARVMVRKGYVKYVSEAFDRYLGTDSPAYMDRFRLTPGEGIDAIQRAGGAAVLAHPGLLPDPRLVDRIINAGIQGIEVYHSKHSKAQTDYFQGLCRRHGLLTTGGSDWHGEAGEGGSDLGLCGVGKDAVDFLEAAAKQHNLQKNKC